MENERTAADALAEAGVFKGAHGLEGLLNARRPTLNEQRGINDEQPRNGGQARRMTTGRRKGAQAARDGLTEADCPYEDHRKPNGRLSWSRAWRNAWLFGFREEKSKQAL